MCKPTVTRRKERKDMQALLKRMTIIHCYLAKTIEEKYVSKTVNVAVKEKSLKT
jgi:hypothetical protein